MEKEDLFYVRIRDITSLRKELLISGKTLIDGLRRYEKYALLNEQKFEFIDKLKHVLDELLVLNKKFRSKMPKVAAKPEVEPREDVVAKPLPKSHMDVLEDELEKIERRLETLR